MTTNQYSTNPFTYTLKSGFKGLPILPALGNLGILSFFMFLYTAPDLLSKQPIYNNGEVSGYVSPATKYISVFFGDEYMLLPCLVLLALCGLAMAICTFNFITSKKQVNVYYSLGITRTKLFLGKYFSGSILLSASIFLPLLIMLVINLATLGFSFEVFKIFFLYLFTFLVVSLSAFTITATVFSCVGTIFEVGIFSAIILFLPDIILYGIQTVMSKFLYGNPYGYNFTPANNERWDNSYIATLSEQFEYSSPVFFGKTELAKFAIIEKTTDTTVQQIIENPSFINVVLWVILTAVIAFLGIKLFNRRKAEIAGFIGTNRVLNTFVSFLSGFFIFALAVSMIEEFVLSLVVGLIGFAIIHLGLELAVLRDLKKFVRGLYKLPIGLVAVSLFAVSINTGLFGYSEKIPEFERIKSVSVSIVGETAQYGLFGEDTHFMTNHNLYFLNNPSVLTGEITAESDIKAVLKAHKLIADSEEDNRTLETAVQFCYTLKDGSSFKRNFKTSTPEAHRALLYLEESQYFKDALYTLFKGTIKMPDPENGVDLTNEEQNISNAQFSLRDSSSTLNIYSKYLDSYAFVELADKDRETLLNALYNDLSNRSVTDKYYPDSTAVAFMRFEGNWSNVYWGIIDNANGWSTDEPTDKKEPVKLKKSKITMNGFSSDKVDFYISSQYNPAPFFVITPDMTETIKVLKDLKLYDELTKTPDFVSAKIIPSSVAYEGAFASEFGDVQHYFSRYFISTYTSSTYTNVDEHGNPVIDDWRRYSTTIDTMFDGYVTNDIKDVEKLLRYSYTAYEQDDTDSGYFVTFYTSTGDTSLCFIPENKLPQEFKVKL
ncbi:MAG: ABC transporter permease [Ruminococcaceae bacterium]|nr:ABC transporter permease [Oscillospiraceae bacterium]